MTETCNDCKWLGVRERDPVVSGQPDVHVCRLDGYRAFPQAMACGTGFEPRPEGWVIKQWTGPVKERKGKEGDHE